MGNQPSKSLAGSLQRGKISPMTSADNLQSYPSFSKADTKESNRSFKSLRSKIPGSRSEITRSSSLPPSRGNSPPDKTDDASKRPGKSLCSLKPRSSLPDASVISKAVDTNPNIPPPQLHNSNENSHVGEGTIPPLTPVRPWLRRKSSTDTDAASRSDEISTLSDKPPLATPNPLAPLEQANESILIKRPGMGGARISFDNVSSASKNQVSMGDISEADVDEYIKRLLDTGYDGKHTKAVCLKNAEIITLCAKARELFLEQPPLIELDAPVKIVGDIHGQYTDLIRMFEMCGFPPAANYLFLGDYVDRGKQSLETILLLLCYKIKYPENFFLLRGNHECANVTRVYGFYDECKRRTNVKIWKNFIDTFNCVSFS